MYTPVSTSENLAKISKRRRLYMFLENLAPSQIKEAQLSPQRNVIAVDALCVITVEVILQVNIMSGIPVRS